jgi:hypothetical protein
LLTDALRRPSSRCHGIFNPNPASAAFDPDSWATHDTFVSIGVEEAEHLTTHHLEKIHFFSFANISLYYGGIAAWL